MIALTRLFITAVFSMGMLLPRLVVAQEEPEFEIPPDLGFLRIVNASGHPGPLWVTVNGVKLAAATGYEDGVATGAMGIQDKSLVLEMKHDGLGEVKQAVTLKAGVITAVIAVAEKKSDPKKGADEKEGKVELVLHLLELPVSQSDQPSTLTLMQFTPAGVISTEVAGSTMALEKGKAQSMTMLPSLGAFQEVKLQGQIVAQLNFKNAAGQVVVLYTNPEGVVKSTQFRNDVQ
jgi:hypothetical protein